MLFLAQRLLYWPCMLLSIVVPVLDEEDELTRAIPHWQELQRAGHEIVVVDGGSSDRTVEIARQAGLPVLESERGRAAQMNTGANASGGDVLLFLHADTRLPANAAREIELGLRGSSLWGRFDVRIDSTSWTLRSVSAAMNSRSRWTGIATGDQAIFVERKAFDAIGGFPHQPLMEDVELSKRLRALSRPACLRARVCTSARRWKRRGTWRTIALMWWLRFAYWRGISPRRLAEQYR